MRSHYSVIRAANAATSVPARRPPGRQEPRGKRRAPTKKTETPPRRDDTESDDHSPRDRKSATPADREGKGQKVD
eukprot:1350578-Pleurochrysis_carterae.AAC.2